jgi:hypothetical protein
MRTPNSDTTDLEDILQQFKLAYDAVVPHWQRMQRLQASYENMIDLATWPTMSEIPVPLMFMTVEQALPYAMDYLFPDNKFVELTPRDSGVPRSAVENAESALHYTLLRKMQLKKTGFKTIKDCYKLGVGYGLVEPRIVTPPVAMTNRAMYQGRVMARKRQMALGEPVLMESYRYISPGQVVPMPDGADPESVSGYFILEVYNEHDFRKMYKQSKTVYGKSVYKGDPDKIVKEAEAKNFHSNLQMADFMAILGGIDLLKTNNGQKTGCVQVPVLKFYTKNRCVWIANGTTKMYEVKDKYQTLRGPLVKASAWPDGDRWFPMSITEASEKLSYGVNVFFNAMMDLTTKHLNPQRVINDRAVLDGRKLSRDPFADIHATTDAREAVSYLTPPPMPQQLFSMGDMLQNWHAQTNAQPLALNGQGSAGLVRGGINAFESLLQNPIGREKLASSLLELGWLNDVVERTIILMQIMAPDAGQKIVNTEYDPMTNDRVFVEKTITQEDLRQVYDFDINLRAKLRNSIAEFGNRAALFDRLMQYPQYVDVKGALEYLANDDSLRRKVLLPDEVIRQNQQTEQQLTIQERAMGIQKAAGEQTSLGEQAAAGASA